MNEVLHYFQTENLRKINDLVKAAANVVAKLVGFKRKIGREKQKKTMVEAQTGEQIKDIRKDISRLKCSFHFNNGAIHVTNINADIKTMG